MREVDETLSMQKQRMERKMTSNIDTDVLHIHAYAKNKKHIGRAWNIRYICRVVDDIYMYNRRRYVKNMLYQLQLLCGTHKQIHAKTTSTAKRYIYIFHNYKQRRRRKAKNFQYAFSSLFLFHLSILFSVFCSFFSPYHTVTHTHHFCCVLLLLSSALALHNFIS